MRSASSNMARLPQRPVLGFPANPADAFGLPHGGNFVQVRVRDREALPASLGADKHRRGVQLNHDLVAPEFGGCDANQLPIDSGHAGTSSERASRIAFVTARRKSSSSIGAEVMRISARLSRASNASKSANTLGWACSSKATAALAR